MDQKQKFESMLDTGFAGKRQKTGIFSSICSWKGPSEEQSKVVEEHFSEILEADKQ